MFNSVLVMDCPVVNMRPDDSVVDLCNKIHVIIVVCKDSHVVFDRNG